MQLNQINSKKAILLLSGTILTSAIGFFVSTSVNVAIPAIKSEFSANLATLQWIVNIYVLALGVFVLISGILGDKLGNKRLLNFGLILFILGTIGSGVANSVILLIITRFIQGVGAAFMIPQNLALIKKHFNNDISSQAIGIWGGVTSAVTAFGPAIGGLLIAELGWRAIFFVNIPLALIALIVVSYGIPTDTKKMDLSGIDYLSILYLLIGLSGLAIAVIQVSELTNFVKVVIPATVIFLLTSFLFVKRQKEMVNSFLDLNIFKNKKIVIANIFTLIEYGLLAGLMFYVMIYLQSFLGFSADIAGYALLPLSVMIASLSYFTGKLADKYPERYIMSGGAALVTLGLISIFLFTGNPSYFISIFPGLFLIGSGFGVFIPALTKSALAVESEKTGLASGINNAVSRYSGLIGTALLGLMFVFVYGEAINQNLEERGVAADNRAKIVSRADQFLEISSEGLDISEDKFKQELSESFLAGYRGIIGLGILLSSVNIILPVYMREDE